MKKVIRLTESELVRLVKRVISEQTVNSIDKKTDSTTFDNIGKTKMWEPIVAEFSKKMKASLTKSGPKEYDPKVTFDKSADDVVHWKQINGHGILFGMTLKSGTLQNGGKSIKYEKETNASKNFSYAKDFLNTQYLMKTYYLTLTADYAQTYNPDIFEIDAKLEGDGRILADGEDKNGHSRLDSGAFTLDFTISINKVDDANTISYGIKVGNFNIEDLINGTITGMDIGAGMTTDDLVEVMGMAVVQGLKNNDNYCQVY